MNPLVVLHTVYIRSTHKNDLLAVMYICPYAVVKECVVLEPNKSKEPRALWCARAITVCIQISLVPRRIILFYTSGYESDSGTPDFLCKINILVVLCINLLILKQNVYGQNYRNGPQGSDP